MGGLKMKVDGFGVARETTINNTEARLLRDADEAFHANDKARCVDAISRLYNFFDEKFGQLSPDPGARLAAPRHGTAPRTGREWRARDRTPRAASGASRPGSRDRHGYS